MKPNKNITVKCLFLYVSICIKVVNYTDNISIKSNKSKLKESGAQTKNFIIKMFVEKFNIILQIIFYKAIEFVFYNQNIHR